MTHVVAIAGLSRASMAAAIVRDDAIAVLEKEQHLRIPVVGRERPAVAEDDGLSAAPVLVVDLDVGSIFFSDCDVGHNGFLDLVTQRRAARAQDWPDRMLPGCLPHVTNDFSRMASRKIVRARAARITNG